MIKSQRNASRKRMQSRRRKHVKQVPAFMVRVDAKTGNPVSVGNRAKRRQLVAIQRGKV